MATSMEDLVVLQMAEAIADGIWQEVLVWQGLAKETVATQLVRAADSVGANIAESYGRYHYGEKLQFLYYARGSLFETKYWLNRARQRQLITPETGQEMVNQLSELAHKLNRFSASIRRQKTANHQSAPQLREYAEPYAAETTEITSSLFTSEDFTFLNSPTP